MKLRVAYAKRRYKDKVYVTPLIVTSYRDENGVARNKTLCSLAKLLDFVVKVIENALKLGDTDVLAKYVHIREIKYLYSIVIGPVFVVFTLLKQLGIFSLLMTHLSPNGSTPGSTAGAWNGFLKSSTTKALFRTSGEKRKSSAMRGLTVAT